MSVLSSSAYYEAVRADVVAAWNVDDVYYGHPSQEHINRYAVIRLGSVAMDWAGLRTVEQSYTFEVIYRAPWIDDDDEWNIELAKEDRANELIDRLMSGTTYASTGLMPLVIGVDFDEDDSATDPYYEVMITFSLMQHEAALA